MRGFRLKGPQREEKVNTTTDSIRLRLTSGVKTGCLFLGLMRFSL